MTTAARPDADTIVLIHGLWMTPLCWEHWIERFSSRGYSVIAPSWPRVEIGIEQLRRHPDTLAGLGVREIAQHYENIVRELRRPPILIGHSFGGAFVQLLLDRGLGAAGVAIHSAPVRGVYTLPLSTLRSTFPVLHDPRNAWRAVALTPRQFHYAFTNTLSEQESASIYDRYHIPGPGRVLFQAAFANLTPRAATRVDFTRSRRPPLLLIAGGADRVVPAAVNQENFRRYRGDAVTDYKEFPGRSHYTLGQAGWEEVADCALDWALRRK
ncbi:MAG TPA: alpha/beta fold hydrolase [Polyangiales bacterium]|nr:alpha/beta fold hydrolase [Polyangiales bacterium]